MFNEFLAVLVHEDDIWKLFRRPNFVATDVQIEKSITVEVPPSCAETDRGRQFSNAVRDDFETLAFQVTKQRPFAPAEQIQKSVVIEVAPNGCTATRKVFYRRKAFALFVAPKLTIGI